jgi:hypothetical protein
LTSYSTAKRNKKFGLAFFLCSAASHNIAQGDSIILGPDG